jgi:aldehyde dehydrogenase (NAD(P)+)
MSGTERGDLLYKLSTLVQEHKETLATIETWDNGMIVTVHSKGFLLWSKLTDPC